MVIDRFSFVNSTNGVQESSSQKNRLSRQSDICNKGFFSANTPEAIKGFFRHCYYDHNENIRKHCLKSKLKMAKIRHLRKATRRFHNTRKIGARDIRYMAYTIYFFHMHPYLIIGSLGGTGGMGRLGSGPRSGADGVGH